MKVRMHSEAADCWCEPVLGHTLIDGSVIWLHRDSDGELPDLLYQVTAIVLCAFGDERDPGDVILDWWIAETER